MEEPSRLHTALEAHFGVDGGAPLLALVTLAALLVRWLVALHPHSGQGRPPMFGDFEAQRHWMEVTVNLPVGEWYKHTGRNDLQYWGLDYPPLTAFVSWAFGAVARVLLPDAVALGSSRGAEDARMKLFMRGSVLVTDALVYIPAVWLFVATRAALQRGAGPAPAPSAARLAADAAPLLLLPGLVLIDHGHFQYNSVALGLQLLAVVAVQQRRWRAAAAVFSLAVHFKQTALYFALPLAAMLLATAVHSSARAPARGAPPRVRPLHAAAAVGALVAVALVVTAALWGPFCVWSAADVVGCEAVAGDALPPGCSCVDGLSRVLRRVFPFNRGLFEDKVANLWCAFEPVLRLRGALLASTPGFVGARRRRGLDGPPPGADALRARIAGASAALTFALLAPSLVALWGHTAGVWRRRAAAAAAAAAAASVVPLDAGPTPLLRRPAEPGAAADASPRPPRTGVARRAPRSASRRGSAAAGGLRTPRRVGAAAAAQVESQAEDVCRTVPAAAQSTPRRRRAASVRGRGAPAACAPTPAAGADAVDAPAPPPWLLWEHLVASLACSALAFFLASFQVHEKAVLLPLLPLALLAHRLPLTAAAANVAGVWTMWPLLARDRLLVPAAVVTCAYAYAAWPGADDVLRGDAAAYGAAWRRWAPRALVGGGGDCDGGSPRRVAAVLHGVVGATAAVMAALCAAAAVLPPPARLPDVYSYATAVVGAAVLTMLLVAVTAVQAAEARK